VFVGNTYLGGLPGGQALLASYGGASIVNYFQVQGAVASGTPSFSALGTDTNIGINWNSKGTGPHVFNVGAYTAFRIDGGGASNQNFLQIYSGSSSYTLNFGGNDTNVNVTYASKGSGFHNFQTGGGTQLLITHIASAVNYILAYGGATGSPATLSAAGSDTNVDLLLQGQGSGLLRIGTYTAGIIAQAGYITIKDAGGTQRRILVG
jgi:hypothetical protein